MNNTTDNIKNNNMLLSRKNQHTEHKSRNDFGNVSKKDLQINTRFW